MMRSKKVKTGVIVGIVLLALVLVGVGIFLVLKEYQAVPLEEEKPPVQEEKPTKTESSFSLVMVGDALIHGAVYYDAKINANYQGYDFVPMLEQIKPIVSGYDLAYYNQETILGGSELGLSHYPRFNSPYEVGDAFLDAGFNLVSLSTNHTMDRGEEAVLNSIAYWDSKKEMAFTAGTYSSEEERNKVRIQEVNGIKYAFFSYTMWTNGLSSPLGKDYLWNIYSDEQAKEDISRVRDQVDVVMVAMHWGTEYSNGVSDEQRETAAYLSSLGVDIIIGSHPHVIEPIEMIDDTLVIYSLGNFISAQETTNQLTGLMASVTVKKVTENEKVMISLENVTAELVYTYYRPGSVTGFKVYPYKALTDSILPGYRNHYETYMNIVVGDNTWITKVGLE